MRLTAGAALLFLVPGFLAGAPPDRPPITVHRAPGPIVVNGDLSDPGWKDAAVIGEFWETQPGDNVPPKVATTAFIAYDAKYLYIGIDARDPEPSKIRAPYVNRDDVLGTDDNVAVDPSLYRFAVSRRDGSFNGSALFSYKLSRSRIRPWRRSASC